ncbi:hypothetical protein F3X89_03690 [Rhizobium rhizogenes]|nr:hypothetical protein F3X89_03690 [Rhizobium rhizogenes]
MVAGISPVLTAASASASVIRPEMASCWKNWRSLMFSGTMSLFTCDAQYSTDAASSSRMLSIVWPSRPT